MAPSDSRAVQLLVLLVLLGLLGITQAFWGRSHFLKFLPMEDSGCLPANFTITLPRTLTVASWSCRRLHLRGTRSPDHHRSGGVGLGRDAGTATYLLCVADRLNITTNHGVDETELDAFIDTLTTNTSFTEQWKVNADTCLATMSADLTSEQQGVYVLACLKKRLIHDCALQSENATLCMRARSLFGSCPVSTGSLVTRNVWRTCKRQSRKAVVPVFTNGGKVGADFCPEMYSAARDAASCALQAGGLASGDALNLPAVRKAIRQGDASLKDQLLTLLDQCEARSTNTVTTFLDCWSELAPAECVTSSAKGLALALLGAPGGVDVRSYGEWNGMRK